MPYTNIRVSQKAIFTFFWIFGAGLAFLSLPNWKQMAKLSCDNTVAAGAQQAQGQSITVDGLAAPWLMRRMGKTPPAI